MHVVALALSFLAAALVAGNAICLVIAARRRAQGLAGGYSLVPFVSALFAVAAWLFGRDRFGAWVLLPALFDPAHWMLLIAAPRLIRELRAR